MSEMPLFLVESLSPLYEDVQLSEVFPDSKFFVDCIPKQTVADILSAYSIEKDKPGFNIVSFVDAHFTLPAETANDYSSANKTLANHLSILWNLLTRFPEHTNQGTLIPLPFPYIIPGGRFREIYYWDSYFTLLGLQVSQRIDIIENMVNNFAYLINRLGFIPNGNRTYYLGRSQPPFFALMVNILKEEKGDNILLQYLPQLEKEYAFWMEGAEKLGPAQTTHRRVVLMEDGSVLNRYWDDQDTPRPEAFIEDTHLAANAQREANNVYRDIRAAAESGWDFSSRWFANGGKMETIQTTAIIPVDLNCLLLYLENTLAAIYLAKDQVLHEKMNLRISKRKAAIQKYCWDAQERFYCDYQFEKKSSTKKYTLAACFPLFVGCASNTEAEQVAQKIEEKFLFPGGLTTTIYTTGQQWDAPNGWAPLQWIAFKGLQQYGHNSLAATIRKNWLATNEKVFAATGKMMEKYNVANQDLLAGGGEYPNQDGFGWTNGVYLAMQAAG